MNSASSLHDLKGLILSLHPVIAIETQEEERVEHLVQSLALELGHEVFEWTFTQGLVRWPDRTPNATWREAGAMLAHLRGMTVEDQLLEARLQKNRDRAFRACQRRLAELGIEATLLDVEHLFDGRRLYFYFLGEVTPAIEAVTQELADDYDAAAQFRQFADTLTAGCGPGCGGEDAAGGGCTSCAVGCAVTGACSGNRRSA